MVSEKRKIGDIGEAIAARFLVSKGFEVIGRNYLKKWGELDIIATKKGKLHFVEVKTVQKPVSRESDKESGSRETGYNPAENVHPKKLERMHRAIMSYLEENQVSQETEWQIDVVIIELDLDSKKATVDLIKNIV